MPPFWLKTNWRVCPTPPTHLILLLAIFLFSGVNQDSKGRNFADAAKVQPESLVALASISIENFRQCFQQWK